MERRDFMQKTALAGASLLAAGATQYTKGADRLGAADKPFNLFYAMHDGMFANHAGAEFTDQIRFAYDMGFRAMEDNGMMGRTPEDQKKIGDTMAALGMHMGVFVLGFDGWPPQTTLTSGNIAWREKFLNSCKQAVEVAKRCHATWITVVPGNFERSLPIGYQTANVMESLRQGAAIFEPHGLVMVLEPLSDNPDLFLRHSDQTFAMCKAVNSPSCKILFDMYHMQRNDGDMIHHIDLAWDEIGYFQIGDNPGRNEPGTGEVNYRNIFKHIYQKGYKGVLGMEHGIAKPGKEGEQDLIRAYRQADDFLGN